MATDDLDPLAGQEPAPEPTLRDELDAAFEQHATDEVDTPTGRARDDLGRFAPKKEGEATTPPAQPLQARQEPPGALAPGAQPKPVTPELKAPASWTPAAREKWAAVDPDIRQEIVRREGEAQRVLQESAGQREFIRSFQSIVAPYEMFIRSENSDPLRAVQSLMNTAAQLRVGTPQAKVGIVAQIVKQHGIDLNMLDSALAEAFGVTAPGQQPQHPAQPQEFRDPRFDQFLAAQQQQHAQREAWEAQQISEGLAAFAAEHEFYGDVRETMADLIDRASARGQQIDLEKIYARACQLDEQVSTIIAQRGSGNGAQQRGAPPPSPAVLRARRAASSIKGNPNPQGSTVPQSDSIRASIEAAFDAHSQ